VESQVATDLLSGHGARVSKAATCAFVAHDPGILRQHGEGLAAYVGGVALQQRLLGRLVAEEGDSPVPLVREQLHALQPTNMSMTPLDSGRWCLDLLKKSLLLLKKPSSSKTTPSLSKTTRACGLVLLCILDCVWGP
jgi:hypothetical protein